MRPIDADALIEKCGDWYVEEGTESGFIGTLKNLLATEPTIQSERKKGEWSDGYRWQRCSLCKQTGKKSWNFCPNCGADMRGEEDG